MAQSFAVYQNFAGFIIIRRDYFLSHRPKTRTSRSRDLDASEISLAAWNYFTALLHMAPLEGRCTGASNVPMFLNIEFSRKSSRKEKAPHVVLRYCTPDNQNEISKTPGHLCCVFVLIYTHPLLCPAFHNKTCRQCKRRAMVPAKIACFWGR